MRSEVLVKDIKRCKFTGGPTESLRACHRALGFSDCSCQHDQNFAGSTSYCFVVLARIGVRTTHTRAHWSTCPRMLHSQAEAYVKLGTTHLALDPHTATVTRERNSGLWRSVENNSNGHSRRACEYTCFVPSVRALAELPITRRATSKPNRNHDCGVFRFLSAPRLRPTCASIFRRFIRRQRVCCAPLRCTRGVHPGLEYGV